MFDLHEIIAFEMRRGGDDSAPASDLKFRTTVQGLEGDELKMKFNFE